MPQVLMRINILKTKGAGQFAQTCLESPTKNLEQSICKAYASAEATYYTSLFLFYLVGLQDKK